MAKIGIVDPVTGQLSSQVASETPFDPTETGLSENVQDAIDEHVTNDDIHRAIDDSGTGLTDLWSANKISSEIVAATARLTVTVGATGADFTTLNEAIDYVAAQKGGTIKILDNVHNYTAGAAKDVSNIRFVGAPADYTAGPGMLFWNGGTGAWTGNNVVFENWLIRARPGSSGSLLTAGVSAHYIFRNCQLMIDGSTAPSLAASILNCNNQVCRIYCDNVEMTRSAPGNRPIISGDANTTIFGFNNSNISAVAPMSVLLESNSLLKWGTAGTTTLVDKASGMVNDSSVAGATVKDALNTLGAVSAPTVFVEQIVVDAATVAAKRIVLQHQPVDAQHILLLAFGGSPQANKKAFTTGAIPPVYELDANEPTWLYIADAAAGEHGTNEEHTGLLGISEGQNVLIQYRY